VAAVHLQLHQVDAFADRPFAGNPAAVVPLPRWLPEAAMLDIAAENNLAETAFFVRRPKADRGEAEFDLRWFTPKAEVPLCGHATLASAYVVFGSIAPKAKLVRFHTRSGPLAVARRGKLLEMDFPALPHAPASAADARAVAKALGFKPLAVLRGETKLMAVLGSSAAVRTLVPDFAAIETLDAAGLVVTAKGGKGDDADCVSRYFAPRLGVPEDPVTGSAHCVLLPYWAEKLGKTKLRARQVSARGGLLLCEVRGERVTLAGSVAPYLVGAITVPVSRGRS
jgi:PhzF family phenazine biosynthesis protein